MAEPLITSPVGVMAVLVAVVAPNCSSLDDIALLQNLAFVMKDGQIFRQ
jgi:hypothetical protein